MWFVRWTRIVAAAFVIALTACGRLDQKTASQLITSQPDFHTAYIERTTIWTGKVPADKVDGPLGENAMKIGLIDCTRGDSGYFNCSFPPATAERAKDWESHDRGGYTDYRVPLYDQKLDKIEMTERSSSTAEAFYQFHHEPNEWGKKFGRKDVGPLYRFKAYFKKYEDGWHVDRLKEE